MIKYQWISVNDKLPDAEGDYLCTVRFVGCYTYNGLPYENLVEHNVRRVIKIVHYSNGSFNNFRGNITAWAHLPEVYMEEQ